MLFLSFIRSACYVKFFRYLFLQLLFQFAELPNELSSKKMDSHNAKFTNCDGRYLNRKPQDCSVSDNAVPSTSAFVLLIEKYRFTLVNLFFKSTFFVISVICFLRVAHLHLTSNDYLAKKLGFSSEASQTRNSSNCLEMKSFFRKDFYILYINHLLDIQKLFIYSKNF